ncbi:MAG: glycerophosphodiester phosphodiesterase [Candidatus Hodarchaeota archaeon]
MNKSPIITAHRGLSHQYPENTLLAFQKAIEIGAGMLELDIRLSGDGKIVVCHDGNLIRASGKKGMVKDLDYDEILKYDVGMGQHVPLLSDVLDLIRGTNVKLLIEFKAFEAEQLVLDLMKERGMEKQVMYASMLFPVMMELRDLDKDAILCPSMGKLYNFNLKEILDLVKSVQGQYLNIDYTCITKELVDSAHDEGIGVQAGTPDELDDMIRMVEIGADVLVTNEPDKILRYLNE